MSTPSPAGPALLFFFETDCPTCRLTAPYIARLARLTPGAVTGISQDSEEATRAFAAELNLSFSLRVDAGLELSRRYDPPFVPALFVLDASGSVVAREFGFRKDGVNELAARLCVALGTAPVTVAEPYDGMPAAKPGCVSRHREPQGSGPEIDRPPVPGRASRVTLSDQVDPYQFCFDAGYADALPVVPPTVARVDRMMAASNLDPAEVVARVPPNYGAATVEKIAANAVMAGCPPALMRVLVPLVRAACDERFNLHGVQATTHFATPLVILNGPVRGELDFASGSNVFSNAARANSTLGRAFQLILGNIGGARPGGIDMSALGNPGKFSYVIAENEEQSPWPTLQTDRGFSRDQSTVTLFAAEPPRGVSEHNARRGENILRAISRVLATVWNFRVCRMPEAFVVLCPEHVQSLNRDGFSKTQVRQFLFDHTGVPVRYYSNTDGEGVSMAGSYEEIEIDAELCYRKFASPEAIHIVVAGGGAGKFSAVIGSWATGPRGSQSVTYPIA